MTIEELLREDKEIPAKRFAQCQRRVRSLHNTRPCSCRLSKEGRCPREADHVKEVSHDL